MSRSNGKAPEPDSVEEQSRWQRLMFGRHDDYEDENNLLMLRAKHKALNLPESGEPVNVDKSRHWHGIGPGALIGVALAAGVPAALVAAALLLKGGGGQPPVAPTAGPADSNYTIRFFDKDGNPIQVPHISAKPK